MSLLARASSSSCNGTTYIDCSSAPNPVCNCAASELCTIIGRTCTACSYAQCKPKNASVKTGSSTGALAGAVTAVIVLAVIAALAFFWWRRRNALRLAAAEKLPLPLPRDIPANPDSVLSRPDPIEKTLPSPRSADHGSLRSTVTESALTPHDPFADQASIQTASARTHSPNVITIGLIPPPDGMTALSPPPHSGPQRPTRSPDLSLRPDRSYEEGPINLTHVNISDDSLRPPHPRFARQSQRSAVTQSSRASTFSNASSAFDILTEAPQIVTPKLGGVRQVLGVVKAEVIQAPGSASASQALHPLSRVSERPMRSPLSHASFTPTDVSEANPFGDETHGQTSSSATSIKSTSTFGQQQHTPTQWSFPPTPTWQAQSRPTSIQSNVGTIVADIGSATRVVFGMQSPQLATTTGIQSVTASGRSSARPPTPPPSAATDEARRMSQASVASSHADSILESFPFVPPSPIAARPPRSPNGNVTFTPPSPGPSTPTSPPVRMMPRLSALSSSSGLSGLGAFSFKFSDSDAPPMPHNSRRASLDTLALSRDLEAFPLPYDDPSSRDSFTPSTK